MPIASDIVDRLQELAGLRVSPHVPLSSYTRFGIGGPAALFAETAHHDVFQSALGIAHESGLPHVVIAGGTNLIVSDLGFRGLVLRFTGEQMDVDGMRMRVEAGASLQAVVDRSIEASLQGMQTMTGIPGSLGAAVYGNAGAYGHSLNERVERVHYTDGCETFSLAGSECEFEYRGSIFKRRKRWVVLAVELSFEAGDRSQLRQQADEIRAVRDAKYPPTMKCAGSIFKNCFLRLLPPSVQVEVPAKVVREGKVPSAWFLEQVGAKGMRRGDIQVASYHANLIYNDGHGTAADLVSVISDLKERIRHRFGFEIEEEVQYVGFHLGE
jgi:UDP-N-acetylmuramate dehydrogenase